MFQFNKIEQVKLEKLLYWALDYSPGVESPYEFYAKVEDRKPPFHAKSASKWVLRKQIKQFLFSLP